MGIFEALQKLITEHGSAAVLEKHRDLVLEQVRSLEKRQVELEVENASLKTKIAELEEKLASQTPPEFVESHGALFKRKAEGGYHEAVFCPRCKGPMFALSPGVPFQCGPCKILVNFNKRDYHSIVDSLPR
jgi:hypothetical protein